MTRTILVVGSNKGIGFATIQLLATRSPSDHILLGVRDLEKGKAAIQQLRDRGIDSKLDCVCIDITSDESILAAERDVRQRFGKLDVLVNNAGVAQHETPQTLREAFHSVFDTNVASVIKTCQIFLPLLRETSDDPRIIQVSSARGSLTRVADRSMPPPRALSYSASKAALNLATAEMAKFPDNEGVVFQMASPGHCRTDLNDNTGRKDPMDGARVVVDLILEPRGRPMGLWEMEGDDTDPMRVPW